MRPVIAAFAVVALAAPALAAPTVGQKAPNFMLNDANGRVRALSDFRGRMVVLEWHNPGCPFVQKHYESGNMQKTQAAARKARVAWLTINSGAPGKQGHISGTAAKALVKEQEARPTAYLLDPKGVVGRGYGAKTTPQMFIIDRTGILVYAGGIDDRPTADKGDIKRARNHVRSAIRELRAGKPVSVPTSRPYGCSVKYPDS